MPCELGNIKRPLIPIWAQYFIWLTFWAGIVVVAYRLAF